MALTNVIGAGYFILMVVTNFILSMYVVLPAVFSHNPSLVLFHKRMIYFFLLNVLGNYTLGWLSSSSVRNLKVEKKSKVDFPKTCKKCEERIPNRCHHCPLCNTCVLKRDHHCFFMCTCIGHYNQKYFIMFCFYQFIAGIYAGVLNIAYLRFKYGVVFYGPQTFITLLPTSLHEWWFKGDVYSSQLFLVAVFYGTMLAGFSAGGFFYWQMVLVYFGQTTHEQRCGIDDYSNTLWCNFKDVFGKWWFISLIIPLPLPPSGNGIYRKVIHSKKK